MWPELWRSGHEAVSRGKRVEKGGGGRGRVQGVEVWALRYRGADGPHEGGTVHVNHYPSLCSICEYE